MRRDAKVEQDAVDAWHLRVDEEGVKRSEVALKKFDPCCGSLSLEASGRGSESHVILVYAYG